MKLIRMAVMALLLALPAWHANAAAQQAKPYPVQVTIANQSTLSPAALADALYAKAFLTGDPASLKQAAKLDPADPVYAYRLALWAPPRGQVRVGEQLEAAAMGRGGGSEADAKTLRQRRALLAQAIKADPGYLPALYLYAVTKQTHQQRMEALEKIAAIDKDNAKPYYVMALLEADRLTKGKQPIKDSTPTAYPISSAEWASVLDLLRKGNDRAKLMATPARAPRVEGITVSTQSHPWPGESVKKYTEFITTDSAASGFADTPSSYRIGLLALQIARQTSYEAQQLAKAGKQDDAMKALQTIQEFADKYMRAEPLRIRTLFGGADMKSVGYAGESLIIDKTADQARKDAVSQAQLTWQMLTKEDIPDELWVVDKAAKISASEQLEYPNLAAEEAFVTAKLKDKRWAR
jgi:hypothetical protein